LLGSAINRIRRTGELPLAKTESPLSAEIAVPVNVDLPLPANIPAAYVPDKTMRLRLYRRLADIHSEAELQALVEEFEDRFGPIPEPVENLLFQLRVRLAAEKANLASISVENNQFVLRFPEDELPKGLPSLSPEVRAGKTALWMPARLDDEWRPRLMELLERLRYLEPVTYSQERQAISSSAGS
jgi:transcription-repair coupling factor (superfamily II helicase)